MLLGQNLCLTRGSRAILSKVSVSLCPGEFIVVLGPSGSGKSTLMKCLSGIIAPDSGQVSLDSKALSDIPERERARMIGVVPQDDIIHTKLRVEAALSYSARLRMPPNTSSEAIQQRVDAVLTMLELTERRSVKIQRLSGGQRKRVSIGVELLDSPRFLFLDEPTSGLDPALEESSMRLFQQLSRKGHSVVASTHSMASLDCADHLLIVMAGRLIYFGPPKLAAPHFGVSHPSEIFKAIRKGNAEQWEARFRGSMLAPDATAKRLGAAQSSLAKLAVPGMNLHPELQKKLGQSASPPPQRAAPPKVAPTPKAESPASAKATPSAAKAAPSASVDDLLASLAKEIEEEEGRA